MGRHGTIAGRKAAQDAKRGALFTKYARSIIMAAKVGGGDPAMNSSLRNAIDKAKSINMPNDKINNAIKRGTGELTGEVLTATTFEGYGPSGIAIIVDTLTDNTNRTTSAVKSIFSKNGGNIGVPGCVSYMFNRKGLIIIENDKTKTEDEVLEIALDAGASDFKSEEDMFLVFTSPDSFSEVLDNLKDKSLNIVESDIELVADNDVVVEDESTRKSIEHLLDLLEDNDDVQKVYTNYK